MKYEPSAIEERIRELVPRLKEAITTREDESGVKFCKSCSCFNCGCQDSVINLEPVLEAIDTSVYCHFSTYANGEFFHSGTREGQGVYWCFGKPLSEQTKETQQFIGSIIFNNK